MMHEKLIERLQKAIDLTKDLYLVVENTNEHTYFVSDVIGDALVELYKIQQHEEMKEWDI